MKFLLLILLLAVPALAELEHILPVTAEEGTNVTVMLRVTDATPGAGVVVGELLPRESVLQSWSVAGNASSVEFSADDRSLVWAFDATATEASISYTVKLPPKGTQASFDAVYAVPGAYGRSAERMALLKPVANVVGQAPAAHQPSERDGWLPGWLLWLVLPVAVLVVLHKAPGFLKEQSLMAREEAFSRWVQERWQHLHPPKQDATEVAVDPALFNAEIPYIPPAESAQPEPEEQQAVIVDAATFQEEIPYVELDAEVKPLRREDYEQQDLLEAAHELESELTDSAEPAPAATGSSSEEEAPEWTSEPAPARDR